MSLKKVIIKKTWYITCIFIVFSVVANFSMVCVAKYVEDIIVRLENLEHGGLAKTVWSACVLCIIYVIFNFGYWFLYNCTVKKAEKLAVEYTYGHYLAKKLDFFSGKGVGDISYAVTSLAADVGTYYATFWPMVFVNTATLLVLFATIASFHVVFSVFIMLGIGLLLFLTSFISKKLAERTETSESLAAEINNVMVQSFQGISVIKVFRRESYFLRKFQQGLSNSKYKNDLIRDLWYSMYIVVYDAMVIIFPVAVLLAGFLLRERGLISIGAVVAIYSLVGNMQEPMRDLASSVTYHKEHLTREAKLGKIIEPCFGEETIFPSQTSDRNDIVPYFREETIFPSQTSDRNDTVPCFREESIPPSQMSDRNDTVPCFREESIPPSQMSDRNDTVPCFREESIPPSQMSDRNDTVPCLGAETTAPMENMDIRVSKLDVGGHTLMENIRFTVQSGDVVSLQGPSGCGKSTLLKLMIGFLSHKGFECRYNGTPQDEIPDTVRYANISLVEQKPFLFSANIRENILLGQDFGQDLFDEVIRVCVLEEMVRQYGLEKEIDWTAGNISGGEMQRITIARTLIRKPKFLLLDEITASLDAKTAGQVAKNIVAFAKKYGIAVVAVSHKEEFADLSNKKIELFSCPQPMCHQTVPM